MDGRLSGAFLGITLQTQPEQLYRALIEATAFGVRWICDTLNDAGVPVRRFVAAGGRRASHRNGAQPTGDRVTPNGRGPGAACPAALAHRGGECAGGGSVRSQGDGAAAEVREIPLSPIDKASAKCRPSRIPHQAGARAGDGDVPRPGGAGDRESVGARANAIGQEILRMVVVQESSERAVVGDPRRRRDGRPGRAIEREDLTARRRRTGDGVAPQLRHARVGVAAGQIPARRIPRFHRLLEPHGVSSDRPGGEPGDLEVAQLEVAGERPGAVGQEVLRVVVVAEPVQEAVVVSGEAVDPAEGHVILIRTLGAEPRFRDQVDRAGAGDVAG